ncbi:eukaryotic translation initiation factor 3 subunit G-like [Lotus japonicus]|uniref:eukaryotic translation initiation factor 3 subunit G-like n=1 Tax=Lotus japonicus TaxID=34305 RepID=UPI00258AFEEC|nr:eukaryotic translation initiation factor 3 subunit G-like [Lotus japonicus]
MRLNPSARVSGEDGARSAATGLEGATGARDGGFVDGEMEGGALVGESNGVPGGFNGGRRSCYSVFIDGIEDKVYYLHLRHLCSKFGKVLNLFVQRQRKSGRIWRFGFVRFGLREQALKAVRGLNGFRLGNASLAVSMARSPQGCGSSSNAVGFGPQVVSAPGQRCFGSSLS